MPCLVRTSGCLSRASRQWALRHEAVQSLGRTCGRGVSGGSACSRSQTIVLRGWRRGLPRSGATATAGTAAGATALLFWTSFAGQGPGSCLRCEAVAELTVEPQSEQLAAKAATAKHERRRWWLALVRLYSKLWRGARVVRRCLELLLRAVPLVAVAPFCWLFWHRSGERFFWWLMLSALQAEGPIAVKFAQWASTRPDLLPRSVCDHFATLQAGVLTHSWADTRRILTEAFGPGWEAALELDPSPVGSGCMAQVYHGWLRGPLAPPLQANSGVTLEVAELPREVAVKVRHPGAQAQVDLDLEVMRTLASTLEAIWPSARYLAMSEAICHFESFVRPQADLRIEARNLDSFHRNFPYKRTGKGLRVVFPEVIWPYVTDALLIESYELSTPLQEVLGQADRAARGGSKAPGLAESSASSKGALLELREQVGKLCMDAFLKMLFVDNFIHGDLHPGNIHFRGGNISSTGAVLGSSSGKPLELVLLDAGLAVQLSSQDRQNFLEVFHALAVNNGLEAGRLMVERSPGDARLVRDREGFVAAVGELCSNFWGLGLALGKVGMGDIFGRMMSLACDHRVKLETSFVTVATSIIVLEGVGRQLNPIVDLAGAARPLLAEAVARRIWQT